MKRGFRRIIGAVLCLFTAVLVFSPAAAASGTDTGKKLLAITFDDGPSKHTTTLLEALGKRGVKATFFIVGSRANAYISTIERMYDEGHQIANHTFNHTYLTNVSASAVRKEVGDTNTYLRAAGGGSGIYVRAPGGLVNNTVKSNVSAPLIGWSVDPLDWKYQNAETVKNNIVKNAKDGDIILVHDLYKTSVEGAVAAIDILLDRGFEFVTVEELLYRRGITPENGVVYNRAPNNGINLPGREDGTIYEGSLENHWAYESIERCVSEGIYKLPSGGRFSPDRPITRGMFITMLGRMAKVTPERMDNTGFSDVPADLYQAPYVVWASKNGIMSGYSDGTFGLGDRMTKEQMITALVRYIDYAGLGIERDIPAYADASKISPWAEGSINFCKYAGILSGSENENCQAQKFVTKGEAAEYICRVEDYSKNPTEYINGNGYDMQQIQTAAVESLVGKKQALWREIMRRFKFNRT